ncbi:unnamed protein product [Sphagnum compactum]
MDGAILPLNFYCRNARLCLRKASISRKANLLADELQHLRVFATLVSSTIPLHPLYIDRKSEKPFLELQSQLPEAAQRILELEDSVPPVSPTHTTDKNNNCLLETEKSNGQPSQMTVKLLLSSSSRPTSDSVLRVEKKTIISQRAPDGVQQWENSSPNMSEPYRFASNITPRQANGGQDMPCSKSSGPLSSTSAKIQGKCSTHVPKMKSTLVELSQERSVTILHPSESSGRKCSIHGFQGGGRNQAANKCVIQSSSAMVPSGVFRYGGNELRMRAPMTTSVPCKQKIVAANSWEGGVVNREEDTEVNCIGMAAQLREIGMTTRCFQSNGTSGHQQHDEACCRKLSLAESGRGWQGSENHTNGLNVETSFMVSNSREHHCSDLSGKMLNTRPVSAPQRIQGTVSGEQTKFPKGEQIDIDMSDGRNRNAMGTYRSRGMKGVKEDCEKFRHQMQMLKEKAEDTRIREVEVEGMADRLQKCLVDKIDLVATRKGQEGVKTERTAWQTVRFSDKERVEFEDIYSPGISPTQNGGVLGSKINASPLPLNAIPFLGQEPDVMKDVREEFQAHKATIPELTASLPSYTHSTSSSTSGLAASSLSSLPLSHYLHKLEHLTPNSHRPPSSCSLYMPGLDAAVGCCNPAHNSLHLNLLTTSASTLEPHPKYDPSTSDYKPSPESLHTSTKLPVVDRELLDSDHLSSKSTAILLPTSIASTHTVHCPLAEDQYNNRFEICGTQNVSRSPTSCEMVTSEQQLGAILGRCTLAGSHLQSQNNMINDVNSATKFSHAKVGQKYLVTADDLSFRGFNNRISEASATTPSKTSY